MARFWQKLEHEAGFLFPRGAVSSRWGDAAGCHQVDREGKDRANSPVLALREATMTSATTQPARGTGGHRADGQGYGLVLFASVLLVIVGCFNLIYGIAAIANSHVFTAHAHYVFGNLRAWGWITLIIGVLQLLAAAGVVAGNQLGRWFGVAVLGLSAIDQMFFIPAYPFWSLMIIAVDVVALYGLCAYGSRANLEAA
jgi:hypothetical protein